MMLQKEAIEKVTENLAIKRMSLKQDEELADGETTAATVGMLSLVLSNNERATKISFN